MEPNTRHSAAPDTETRASADVGEREGDRQRDGSLARALRATSGMTLVSRLFGLVRDVLIGRIFADNPEVGSAFNAAFTIPNIFRRLFGEGALSAAFIPAYASARRDDGPGEAGGATGARLASLTLAVLGLATALLTVVIELALLTLLVLLPHDAERALSLKLIMVMLPFMPFICVAAILAGMLQVHGRFGPAASGPILLNTMIVIVATASITLDFAGDETVAYVLGIATVASGVSQVWWFARLLRPHARFTRDWSSTRGRAREMLRAFVPVAIGLGTLQLSTFLDTLIAMWPIWVGPSVLGHPYPMDASSNFILGQTTRLYQFPLGVFGIAVATAVFPLLARHADDRPVFIDTLRRGVRLSLFIGTPASLGLLLVRRDALALLYGHGAGAWSAEQIDRAAAVLAGFAIGVWAYALNHVLTRAFYARRDTRTPMRVSIAMVVLGAVLNLALMWSLREAGLAWATSIGAVTQSVLLVLMARRRLFETSAGGEKDGASVDEPIFDQPTRAGVLRIVISAGVMGGAVAAALLTLPSTPSFGATATRLALSIAIGAAAFVLSAIALRCPEIRWIVRRSAGG